MSANDQDCSIGEQSCRVSEAARCHVACGNECAGRGNVEFASRTAATTRQLPARDQNRAIREAHGSGELMRVERRSNGRECSGGRVIEFGIG